MILYIGKMQGELRSQLARFIPEGHLRMYTDAADALLHVEEDKSFAVFIDAELAEIAKAVWGSIAEKNDIAFIYLTQDAQFAMRAYELNAFDCLLRPVSESRLARTIDRLKDRYGLLFEKSHKVQISILGMFSVLVDEKPVHWMTAKSAEIFAYLLMNDRKNGVEKWKIIKALWPEKENASSDLNFRSNLSRLKKTLEISNTGMSILSLQGAYRLETGAATVDAFELKRFAEYGGSLSEEYIPRIEELIQSFDGDLFYGFDFSWRRLFCENYQAYFERLAQKLCRYYIDQKEFLHAEAIINKCIAINAYNEDAQELRLLLKQRLGKTIEAEKYYKELYAKYMQEFGREPSKRLKKYVK